VILTNDEDLAKKLNSAIFPGLQGGPLMHIIAAKAVAFREALRPEFKLYAHRVVENARALAASLMDAGLGVVSGGTDNHLMLVDLTPKGVTGKAASGIRLGTPAGTTRGFGPTEFREVGQLIARVVDGLSRNGDEGDGQVEQHVRDAVAALTSRFPIYPEL
jgi:glycine hydroxymethyltransferase